MDEWVPHLTINHAVSYVEGLIHTNTGLLVTATGQYHHCKTHAAAYIIEACFKYNNRNNPDAFGQFLRTAVNV